MNKHAQPLGHRARGAPKVFTLEELQKRIARLVAARAKRWPEKESKL